MSDIINDLKSKKAYLIDDRAIKNIKSKQVSYKLIDESNSITGYKDHQRICYSDLNKNPYNNELNLGIGAEKFQLIGDVDAYMQKEERNFVYG